MQHSTKDQNEARAASVAASLPDDREALLDAAAAAVRRLHEAVLIGADLVVEAAQERYSAVIWKLNGSTFFGSNGDEDAASRVVERYCQAAPGEVPMWGQVGEFLIEVDGVRAVVEIGRGYRRVFDRYYAFHAVDLDRPFISETGFRAHFDSARKRVTVDQVTRGIFAEFLRTHRRYLEPDYQNRLAAAPVRPWLASLAIPARHVPAVAEDWRQPDELPAGFAWVDVILPAHQAFIARKWAATAKAKVEAQRSGAKVPGGDARVEADAGQVPSKPVERDDDEPPPATAFTQGMRCQVIHVHHPCFEKEIGKHVIITKISAETRQVWAHDDRPAIYRVNRNGRKVCEYDPRCIESCYSFDLLQPSPKLGEKT
ncbi:Protein KlcB (plasmid) [Xanthomonas hydrangeae]|uniref:klcB n=1 Tax=Xanthomonas hydrangeae TaxID=2775159 RepID=UPI001963F793|nr:Protein KlcB [Xanthomonas hydrangeae]CAD7741821.1 Protein KlcB [Xanthomonas hydrangeae]CAD7748088.1 Protein KlcB [Xanthomonas hydrangeae]CAD7748089.1 Protein KlcB [Xanthomonas hydrangeae]CAD7748288.1 Protein KlcB [Xanthomonas hydrangeae]